MVTTQARRRFTREWIAWVTLGQTAGLSVTAVAAAIVTYAAADPWVNFGILVSGGAVAGVFLGLGQWTAFRRSGIAVSPGAWVSATAAGVTLAWSIGLVPGILGFDWADLVTIPIAIALVLALLMLIPVLQFFVLRRYRRGAWRWIPINAIAWVVAALWIAVPIPFIGASTDLLVLFGVFAGAGLAVAVTAATFSGVWARSLVVTEPAGHETDQAVLDDSPSET